MPNMKRSIPDDLIKKVGKLRESGHSVAYVRDHLNINETTATHAWRIYRERTGAAARPTGPTNPTPIKVSAAVRPPAVDYKYRPSTTGKGQFKKDDPMLKKIADCVKTHGFSAAARSFQISDTLCRRAAKIHGVKSPFTPRRASRLPLAHEN